MASPTSDLRPTEEVVLYATYAFPSADGRSWTVRLRGAVFERHRSLLKRTAYHVIAGQAMKFSVSEFCSPTFRERFGNFLVRWQEGRTIAVRFGTSGATAIATTGKGGHLRFDVELSAETVERLLTDQSGHDGWSTVEVILPPGDERRFLGEVQFLPRGGVSIISDIDDTLRNTCVQNRRELLANTFLRPFQPVAGMARLYEDCRAKGAAFHYVSGSPWQLYGPLRDFLKAEGLPLGSFDLKYHELGRKSSLDDFESQFQEKLAVIGPLLAAFPERRFLLIGDSGQQDPELYARLAETHRDQIVGIFIRNVSGEPQERERLRALLTGRETPQWMVFVHPEEIGVPMVRLVEHFTEFPTGTSPQSATVRKSH